MPNRGHNKVSGVLYDKPGNIEHYEKRFGLVAIEKGFICADDLVQAFTVQVDEDIHHVPHRLMGEILFDLGIMTDKQVEEVLSHIFNASKANGEAGSSTGPAGEKKRTKK